MSNTFLALAFAILAVSLGLGGLGAGGRSHARLALAGLLAVAGVLLVQYDPDGLGLALGLLVTILGGLLAGHERAAVDQLADDETTRR